MLAWLRALAVRAVEAVDVSVALVSRFVTGSRWLVQGRYLALAEKAYGQNALVYACLRFLSQSVPEASLAAYKRLPDGTVERLPDDDPLVLLIRHPNELMTEFEFWELTEIHLNLAGRAHWWKHRDLGGRIIALWPLRPDRVAPIYSMSSEAGQRVLSGWAYTIPGEGQRIAIGRSEVMSFNLPDPASETGGIVEGLGPAAVLAREISADNEATSFVASLLSNYAQPSLLIKTKQPIRKKEEAQFLKRAFMRELGDSHRGEPALLDGDTQIEKLSFDLQQLEFPALRANAETRVAAAFGVPPILVGLKAGLDRATYSNAEQAGAFFAERTLAAKWRRYADQYSQDVALEFGDDIYVEFDTSKVRALSAQRMRELEPTERAFKGGALTINEYRAALGKSPVQDGDVLLVPSTTIPQAAELEDGAAKMRNGSLAIRAMSLRVLPAPADELPEAVRLADTTRQAHATALESEIAQALTRQGERIAKRFLDRHKEAAEDVFSEDADNTELTDALRARWELVFTDAFADASHLLGVSVSFSLDLPDIPVSLASVEQQVKLLTETTKDELRRIILHGLDEGLHPSQIADLIRDAGIFKRYRAETIARTVTTDWYAQAAIAAYRASGLVDEVRIWDGVDFDEPCIQANGKVWTLEYYEQHRYQHPRCRRVAAPVVRG